MPLSQTARQSTSVIALHALGQQESGVWLHRVMVLPAVQRAVHIAAEPIRSKSWQPLAGQAVGHDVTGSQVSPASTTLLPQVAEQSTSRFAAEVLHSGGQHPSMVVPEQGTATVLQRALQVGALPVKVVTCQQAAGMQLAGVGQVLGGSQVSPAFLSTTPSPQPAQSMSVAAVQPTGQQRSMAAVWQVFGVLEQTTLQVAALPVVVSVVQSFWSSQLGQDPGGSQVSPASMRALPQPAQSTSVAAAQAVGQQLSATVPLHADWAQVTTSPAASPVGASAGGRSAAGASAPGASPAPASSGGPPPSFPRGRTWITTLRERRSPSTSPAAISESSAARRAMR
jgi:hypothetical protein